MYSRILVPVDLDNVDKLTKALDLAAETATQHKADVIYVDVVDAVPTASPRTEGERMSERLKSFASQQADKHAIQTTGEVTLRSDLRLNVGPDIVKAADELKCDLVVIASHVPGLKEHFFASNV
ncbi:MAG: universal stress protein [Pseudomonadota bacterium]